MLILWLWYYDHNCCVMFRLFIITYLYIAISLVILLWTSNRWLFRIITYRIKQYRSTITNTQSSLFIINCIETMQVVIIFINFHDSQIVRHYWHACVCVRSSTQAWFTAHRHSIYSSIVLSDLVPAIFYWCSSCQQAACTSKLKLACSQRYCWMCQLQHHAVFEELS